MALHGSFLIDRDGVVRHCLINDLGLGRNTNEALRMINALGFSEEHGQVCPANWEKDMPACNRATKAWWITAPSSAEKPDDRLFVGLGDPFDGSTDGGAVSLYWQGGGKPMMQSPGARHEVHVLAGIAVVILLLSAANLPALTGAVHAAQGGPAASLSITSPAYAHQESIPAKYTCEGADTSPPLSWTGLPSGTQSLALIVDDPDAPDPAAPRTTWVHWVLYNIPPGSDGLAENADHSGLPRGTLEGRNDWRRTGYRGPCPPIGRHRYVHKLYALDAVLPDLGEPAKARLEQAMEGHVLERAELIGTYKKGE